MVIHLLINIPYIQTDCRDYPEKQSEMTVYIVN